jgi:polygalacturonase
VCSSDLFWSGAETLNIKDFGAKDNGEFLNTTIINQCITSVAEKGGGYVVIPAGIFLSGTVELKSNVYLKLDAGAVLKGSPNLSDYKRFEGHRFDKYLYHLVTAKNASHTGILGEGTIDGNGTTFWEPFAESDMPAWIKAKDPRVSRLVEFTNCQDITIKGITIQNTPEWTLHLFNCRGVNIDGIHISNHLFGPNADGIDLTGCQQVTISNCRIETCDDGICLKTNWDSDSCAQIAVTNCVIKTLCAALKIGNESAKDFRQITFSNCVVYESSRAISINSEEGGVVEDVFISNIIADNNAPLILTRPIHISLLKSKKGKSGSIRNIRIQDFVCKTQGRILITAEKGTEMENIQLRNIRLRYPWIEDPYLISDSARSAQYSPQNKTARKQRAAVVAENVKNLVVNHLQIEWPQGDVPKDWRLPVRIENGSRPRRISPNYSKNKECDLQIFWGSLLNGGYIWAPNTLSSDGKTGVIQENCRNFTVR